ncbi:UNVERIFIED_CONTAM: hypothetical protein FKN15_039338 [Acipenser sinensis]
MLLREVIAQNPFSSKEPGRVWAKVGELITTALQDESFEVDARRCRERTALLLDYYKKQDFPSLRRFGTERLYAQKEDLLHEILTFLEKRSEAEQRLREEEMALRREELEIQRGKITLERERLEAERRERERRFQLESQERQGILDLLKDRGLQH